MNQLPSKFVQDASSMLNAVTVSFIVALFSASLIALWYSNELVVYRYQDQIDLIEEHSYAVQFVLSTHLLNETSEDIIVSENQRVTSSYTLSNWGLYKVLNLSSRTKNDSLSKSYLLGNTVSKKPNNDLFLLDSGKPLKYAGFVSFAQDITIPNARIESHFLPKVTNTMEREGKIESSEKELPKLDITPTNYQLELGDFITIEEVLDQGGSLINDFTNETVQLRISGLYELRNVVLKGNIVITANAPLMIHSSAILNDVIIQAPEVTFLENFRGNLQVVPQKRMELRDNTSLAYPSAIYAHSLNDSLQVDFGPKALLNGSLIIDSNSSAGASKRRLTLDKNSIIRGDVYCNGTAEIQGTIYGRSIINRFQYKTKTTVVDNLVVDATFDSKKIPTNFTRMPLKTNDINTFHVIKEL